jgi:hypothetical protein
MKIIGFSQLRNELEKGNLINWSRQMAVCDYVYIFDQNSTDGSKEYYKQFENFVVIESETNRFGEELICKQELLSKLLKDHPDTDWILWLDGDTLLDGRLLKDQGRELRGVCEFASGQEVDACFFEHYNLWRSDIFYRIDDNYHSLSGNLCALWRNNGTLTFNSNSGLHLQQYPNGISKGMSIPFAGIHRGFATDYQILTRYEVYKSKGQSGWDLERLLNENGLTVQSLNVNILPEWFQITDRVNPLEKQPIIEIYNAQKY